MTQRIQLSMSSFLRRIRRDRIRTIRSRPTKPTPESKTTDKLRRTENRKSTWQRSDNRASNRGPASDGGGGSCEPSCRADYFLAGPSGIGDFGSWWSCHTSLCFRWQYQSMRQRKMTGMWTTDRAAAAALAMVTTTTARTVVMRTKHGHNIYMLFRWLSKEYLG